ncbi:MAG: DUF1707 domain-containing protein [Nocardioides sp.]|uniref:DUF1707 SHOCT-like domain-containing protein n=1 Tax=Nocardioides sp. TaxID=35761 RepID=UPI003F01880E
MGQLDQYGNDPSQMRISDADREKVADVLRTAAGEGRLDFDELDDRLEATYKARTYAELVPITVDLPAHADSGLPSVRPTPRVPTTVTHDNSWAVMSETKRQGAWVVPARHTAFSLMGSVVLDLREATFSATETEIVANSIMGEVQIIVDEHTHVVVDGTPIMGEFVQGKDKVPSQVTANSPTVRVTGMALMASVNVQRQPPPGTPKKFLGSY